MTEQSIKMSILQHFKNDKTVMLDNIKNMGTARVNKFTGKVFYTRGMMRRGVADLQGSIIMGQIGQRLAIEVKTPEGLRRFEKNKVKPYTTEWHENEWGKEVIEKGGIYIVADSVEMVLEKLKVATYAK